MKLLADRPFGGPMALKDVCGFKLFTNASLFHSSIYILE
jgi:hypothetical protein